MASWSFVYIAASADRRLYIGVTKDLELAAYLLGNGAMSPRLRALRIDCIVLAERFATIREAESRQQDLRRMGRARRIAVIEAENPTWKGRFPVAEAAMTYRGGGPDASAGSAGVPARLGPRPSPRIGADAKAWPDD